MTAKLEIREARAHHVGRLVRRLRTEHAQSFAMLGSNPHTELRTAYSQSFFRRTAFLEGEIFAIWGCTGSFLSPVGVVWLAISKLAERHPLLLIKETRRQLAAMMVTKTDLMTIILDGDEGATRFATFLGFHVDDTIPGSAASSCWGRRNLRRYMTETPGIRVPFGNSFIVRMGYHPNAHF